MSCGVAISKSPVFSPSSSLFCSSPETLSLINSPLRLHKPPPPSGLIRVSNDVVASPETSSFSKRIRPAKLDIPAMNLGFGGTDLETAAAGERRRETVEEEADGYSVFSKRGRRAAMEDRFSTLVNVNGDPKHACFGIFDGHGGAKAAEFAANNLNKNVVDQVEKMGDGDVVEAVKEAYLKTDSDFLKEDIRGGSCCVTAIIWKGDLVVSNAGDCRAVVSRGGVAEALTSDHRPSREDEKSRIEALGGYVDSCHGVWRIQGSLAVSRGIGDRHLKQWVIAEPETKVVRIEPDLEFLILASDGLWDKVSNQEAVDVACTYCTGTDNIELLSACKKLADLSMSRGSADDTSVMIIRLGSFC